MTTQTIAIFAFISILCAGSYTTCSVFIISAGADITLSNSARHVSDKFANAIVSFKVSQNSRFMGA